MTKKKSKTKAKAPKAPAGVETVVAKPARSVVVPPPPPRINPSDALIDGQPLPQSHGRMNTGSLPKPPPKAWTKPVR